MAGNAGDSYLTELVSHQNRKEPAATWSEQHQKGVAQVAATVAPGGDAVAGQLHKKVWHGDWLTHCSWW
jgi:hypothetical protein